VASAQTALELVALLERHQPGAGAGCARLAELLDWCTDDLACMFHEGGCVSHAIAKRINLTGRLFGFVALGQFVPIHFQEKCSVTV
jgi:hypothetical protein